MATVIKLAKCPACGHGSGEWREAKAGAASFICPHCKFQGFAKSPVAASAVRAAEKPGDPAGSEKVTSNDPAPKKEGGWFDKL